MKFFTKSILIFVLLGLVAFSPIVSGADDKAKNKEDEVLDDALNAEKVDAQTAAETEADGETAEELGTGSPNAKTHLLFIKPESTDLQAGRLARVLVGFHNNGTDGDFVIQRIEGSFRYPQDYSYYIQNFTHYEINKVMTPEMESTFEYMFTPSETFSSRQFGLTINLKYKNSDGKEFTNTLFNETVNIVEPEEGLDGETFFLYIFLAAILVLCSFGIYQLLLSFGKKSRRSGKSYTPATQKVSNGNVSNSDDVDFEWIPQSHLQPNKSPKTSPRLRKTKNGAAVSSGNSSGDE